jgi:hypothetical protein
MIWKTVGIVFIILFILESLFITWITYIGYVSVTNENNCSKACYYDHGMERYNYDDVAMACYCIDALGKYYRDS